MKLADFHYDLPPDRIAQEPVTPRDQSRLMVLTRNSAEITHRRFAQLPEFLKKGDVLVVNSTKVFPARLRGKKKTGGKIEVLLLNPLLSTRWRALVRGATQPTDLEFPEGLYARMTQRLAEGEWEIEFSKNHVREYLDRHGEMPLPPYIKREGAQSTDTARYQTVYAEQEGAVAAPTAGFHFTPELIETLRNKGVQILDIVLHVGWGTFRPVRTKEVEQHAMLPERYEVSEETATALNQARRENRRVIAVGTTATRTLESIVSPAGQYTAGSGESNLFIYPGYQFRGIDGLITNFHLPDSTPLLLACAFMNDSRDVERWSGRGVTPPRLNASTPPLVFSLRAPYLEAVREGYRFYSYGDAMFIQ